MKQKKKQHNVILNHWDYQLFQYLHATKVATIHQIERDIPHYKNITSLTWRLWKLRKVGLISAQNYYEKERKKVFSITNKTLDTFITIPVGSPQTLLSGKVKHDLQLVDIRNVFLKLKNVTDYYTENQIKTWCNLLNDKGLGDITSFNFDASFTLSLQNMQHNIGLQHEISLKSRPRYKELFRSFYECQNLSAIFYICRNRAILNYLMEVEKEAISNKKKKIYYKTLSELKQEKPLVFLNAKNLPIQLE